MKSWGQLPMNMIDSWSQRRCDLAFTAVRMSQIPISSCINNNNTAFPIFLQTLSDKQYLESSSNSSINVLSNLIINKLKIKMPLIAIMAASTTRKIITPSTDNLALFTFMLPSLIRTIDCGFRYVYVLGYDKNDPFYDTEEVIYINYILYFVYYYQF